MRQNLARCRSATPSGQAAAGPSSFGSGPKEQRRRSSVPDHVKNPQVPLLYALCMAQVGGFTKPINCAR